MLYQITHANSPLFSVNVTQSVYGKGMIHLSFWKENGLKDFAERLKLACDLEMVMNLYVNVSTTDVSKLRKIIEFLKSISYISEHDYAVLITHNVKSTEAILDQQPKVIDQVTTMQRDTLKFIFEPYIEEIIENAGDFDSVILIVASTMQSQVYYKNPTNIAFLKPNDVIAVLNKAGITGERVESITGCAHALWDIFSGNSNLESTFKRQAPGEAIPSLPLQRKILIDELSARLFAFFPNLSLQQKLFSAVVLEIYANATLNYAEVANIYFSSIAQTVNEVLSNNLSKRVDGAMNASGTMPGGRSSLLERALTRGNFNNDELQELKKIDCTLLQELIAAKLKPKNTFTASLSSVKSPVIAAGDAHNDLLKKLQPIVANDPGLVPFMELITSKQYSKALRSVCTIKKSLGTDLLEILIGFKKVLNIDINERAGVKLQSALHHAAVHNHESYLLLVSNGANTKLTDASGILASSIYESVQSKLANVKHSPSQ